ncbi:MAG: hypothetical protein E6J20_18595 [Chloroflexi bacterium]|nr:MAG: hypothetical protein E6J20_18595 [Chloroflexota bacterium]
MPRFNARVTMDVYVDVTVEAEDEETARDCALQQAWETLYPQISDSEVVWIEGEAVPDVRVETDEAARGAGGAREASEDAAHS